jgi:hypothetical protein
MKKTVALSGWIKGMPKPVQQSVIAALLAEKVKDVEALTIKRTGNEPLRRTPSEEDLKALEGKTQSVVHYVSTRDMDLDREILMPGGAILDAFRAWPQVYENHNISQPPIAKDEWIVADKVGIKALTSYAPTTRGKDFWLLRSGGFLNSSSVGFVPLESYGRSERGFAEAAMRCAAEWEEFKSVADEVERITPRWLLIEHSDAWTPANRNALTLALSAKSLDVSTEFRKEHDLETEEDHEALDNAQWSDFSHKTNACGPDGATPYAAKPYPSEHAARLVSPDKYDEFRRENDKFGSGIHAIWGIIKGPPRKVELQAIRFDASKFTVAEARAWLKEHDHKPILFEPASGKREQEPERVVRVVAGIVPARIVRVCPDDTIAAAVRDELRWRLGRV